MRTISVVVPFHGREPWLARCLDGLLSQRYPAAQREFLFVDNGGSTEARLLVARHPSVRLLDEPRRGAYVARNRGIRSASGSVIAFTDADCAPAPDWLESIASAMGDPATAVVVGSYQPAVPGFAASILADYENEKNRFIFSSDDGSLRYGYTNNMAARAELFDTVGSFVERLRGSDALFVRRVVDRIGPDAVRFVPAMAVQHLEVTSVTDYYRKVFVHSRSIAAMAALGPQRALTVRERLQVYARTVRARNDSLGDAIALLAVLAGGLGVWGLGAAAGMRMRPGTPRERGRPELALEREVSLRQDPPLGGAADVVPARVVRQHVVPPRAVNSSQA